MKRLARSIVNRLAGNRLRRVRVLGGPSRGARLLLNLQLEKAYWLGRYERDVQDILAREIRAGDVFFDVGANIGFFAVLAARRGARVVAVEPATANADRIRSNAALNRLDIDVIEAAAWDGNEDVALAAGDSAHEWRTVTGRGTRAVTLDTLGRPDVIKMDIEGAEEHAIVGARAALASCRLVVCEVHGEAAEAAVRAALAGWKIETVGGPSRLVARRA
jgi:FkbM family methyltransferase